MACFIPLDASHYKLLLSPSWGAAGFCTEMRAHPFNLEGLYICEIFWIPRIQQFQRSLSYPRSRRVANWGYLSVFGVSGVMQNEQDTCFQCWAWVRLPPAPPLFRQWNEIS